VVYCTRLESVRPSNRTGGSNPSLTALLSFDKKTKILAMKGFVQNIEKSTLENTNFRKVLYTGKHSQLVLMTLAPNEEIGMEVHPDNDQFFRFETGTGKVIIDGNEYAVSDGFAVVVPAGAQHNIINVSASETLNLYTIYSPAHHKDGIVRPTKAEAVAQEAEFDGTTTE
jgi:mannose-6-phosphate isomerase-like protein (cupin superfamily)